MRHLVFWAIHAVKLGLLKLYLSNVNSVNDRKSELLIFFTGIGKLKNYRLKIPIDPVDTCGTAT